MYFGMDSKPKCVVCGNPVPKNRGLRALTCSKICAERLKNNAPVAKLKSDREPNEYQKAISEIGWNQIQAAEFLGINPRTSRSYASGSATPSSRVQQILGMMLLLKRKVTRRKRYTGK